MKVNGRAALVGSRAFFHLVTEQGGGAFNIYIDSNLSNENMIGK